MTFRTLAAAVLLLWAGAAAAQQATGTRTLRADLSADEQPKATVSNAKGSLDLTIDLAAQTMRYEVRLSDLSSAVSAVTLHGPVVKWEVGPEIANLAPDGVKTPLVGSAPITDGQIRMMLNGEVYINVRTAKHPAGEIRGQLYRVPQPDPGK